MKIYVTPFIAPLAAGFLVFLTGAPALADKISHPTAVFSGLDKITGRIISFDVAAEETVQFGSLQITPHACFTRPPTEAPLTTGFVEVDEVQSNKENKKVFSGWMFAASPGLHGLEHPVYDIWLTDCKGGSAVITETVALPQENILAAPAPKPGTVPRSRQNQQARPAGAPPAQGGVAGPLDGQLPTALGAPSVTPSPQRGRGNPVPPAQIPTAAAQAPRRTPVQSFFPTFANPGDYRERDRAVERAFER